MAIDRAAIRAALTSFVQLDDQAADRLCDASVALSANRGDRIFATGDACAHFLVVTAGRVRVELATRTGREVTLFRIAPGETCALTTSCILQDIPYFAQAVAETDVDAIGIPSQTFRSALSATPQLMERMLADYARRIAGLITVVDRLASRDISADLAALLIERAGKDGGVKATHDRLAKELGTAREVVTRHLAELERRGLITRSRAVVTVHDRDGLNRLAGLGD